MRVILMDTNPQHLRNMESILRELDPCCEVRSFQTPNEALKSLSLQNVDIAFLALHPNTDDGLLLAMQMRSVQHDIRIIFMAQDEKYAFDAFSVHASGYLLEPIKKSDVLREFVYLFSDDFPIGKTRVRIQTFGGFAVFVNDQLLRFPRSRSKELLAYLVNKRGIDVTTRQACAILWENAPYDLKQKNYFQSVLFDLRRTLQKAGIEDILIHRHNSLAVNIKRFECDSYRFLDGDVQSINNYRQDYLSDYSWAESMAGVFAEILEEQL